MRGGALALWRTPTAFFMSLSLGFASGVLLAMIAPEMIPRALGLGSLPIVILGFIVGLAAVSALDLFVRRGQMAGEPATRILG
jgi:zinc transporter, ZIP family